MAHSIDMKDTNSKYILIIATLNTKGVEVLYLKKLTFIARSLYADEDFGLEL